LWEFGVPVVPWDDDGQFGCMVVILRAVVA